MAREMRHIVGRPRLPLRMTPLVLLAVFLVLLVIGITLGEPSRVLEQARSICLSCIGIG
ncbi:MAG: CD1871A family CXXC motif-containing protein [Desulfobulbus sp.]